MDFDPAAAVRPLLETIEELIADVVMPAKTEVILARDGAGRE